jgi:anti-sigma factor RsiW
MTHDTAISTMSTERYLLGDMSPEERSEFEAHYFDCAICADDVKAAYDFRDALTATVLTERGQ